MAGDHDRPFLRELVGHETYMLTELGTPLAPQLSTFVTAAAWADSVASIPTALAAMPQL